MNLCFRLVQRLSFSFRYKDPCLPQCLQQIHCLFYDINKVVSNTLLSNLQGQKCTRRIYSISFIHCIGTSHFKMPSLSWWQKFFTPEVKSSVIERGASDISGHRNTINELKVCVHYTFWGKGHLVHLLGQNIPATKREKTCPETDCSKAPCDNKGFQCSQRSYSFWRIYLTFFSVQ